MEKLNLKTVGVGLGLIGGLALLFATFFDTAPEGTHNIGLMQVQMLWALFAAVCLLISAMLIVGHHLGEKLDGANANRTGEQ